MAPAAIGSDSPGALGTFMRRSIFVGSIIVAWYLSNILVLLLNKYLLTSIGFVEPCFLTACHMAACAIIGGVMSMSGYFPLKRLQSLRQAAKVAVLSIIFCATIVLGNASLEFIPVSFNQAVGSTTPFFTAMMAFAVLGQRENVYTYYALAPICIGVVIASGGEKNFHALGFALCIGSAAGRAFKSVVQSMLMSDPAEKLDPMSLLMYMSSLSFCLLVPITLVLEPTALSEASRLVATSPGFAYWLIGNSIIAYFVNLTNFLVTKHTSALTLQVLGNAKGVVAAAVSVALFKNVVTWQGCLGYAITVAGCFWYSEAKRWAKAQAQAEKEGGEASEPLLSSSQGAKQVGGSSSEHLHSRATVGSAV